jgi:hypothetical protein
VTLVETNGDAISTLQDGGTRVLVNGVDLELEVFSFQFLPDNRLIIDASFRNITADSDFLQPFFFTRSERTSNIVSSIEPEVTDDDLGGDGILSPSETTAVLRFEVVHRNQPFAYFVDAHAAVEAVDPVEPPPPPVDPIEPPPPPVGEDPVVTITIPTEGDVVSSNVIVQGTATDDDEVVQLTYNLNDGPEIDVTISLIGEDFGFSISAEDLLVGNNSITVLAYDAEGNVGSDTVNVIYNPETPPEAGRDIVVLNDINVFTSIDRFGTSDSMQNPNNVRFVQNLVNFPATGGPRDAGTVVLFDRGRNSMCAVVTDFCSDADLATMRSVIEGEGFTIEDLNSSSGSITSIPGNVRTIFLWNPLVAYTAVEVNTLKRFAAEGGRIVFVGEHEGFYAAGIPIQNQFLQDMGAVMTNVGDALDGAVTGITLPEASLRPHQITTGMTNITVNLASEVVLGPNDFPLFFDSTNTRVLAGVASIDITPITETSLSANDGKLEIPTYSTPGSSSPSGD